MTVPRQNLVLGVTLTVVATFLVGLVDLFAKWLGQFYAAFEVAFLRSAGGFFYITLFAAVSGRVRDLRTRKINWHMLRAVLVTFIMVGVFYALTQISMLETEAIGHAAPFFVALMAPFFINEKPGRQNWIAIGVGFLGVLLVLRPDPDHFHWAHLLMFFCSAGYAMLIVLARMLSVTESILALNFYIYPLTAVVTGVLSYNSWITPPAAHWLPIALFGLCGSVAVVAFVAAVRYMEAALCATFDYVTLIWVSFFGYLFWQEVPDIITVTGIVIIVGSGVYIVRHTTRKIDESIVQTPEH